MLAGDAAWTLAASSAPLLTAVAALVTAVAGAGVAVYGAVRSAKADEAKRKAEAATSAVDGQRVGLEYMRESLRVQGELLTSTRRDLAAAEVRIDALESDLRERTRERDDAVAELANYRRRGMGA